MEKVNISEKLAQFTDYWNPRVVGELNEQHVKLVKLKGDFIWHHHENADELFLVIKGKITIHLRDRLVELEKGEFFIVPRGVEHKTAAENEAHIMLFEPKYTINTGNVQDKRTKDQPEQI